MAMVSIDLDPNHEALVLFVVVRMDDSQLMSPASGFTSRLVPFKLLWNDRIPTTMDKHKNGVMKEEREREKI